ncbi:MAG: exodeoxyribonuclease VII large subunit [Bacteroidaceae bacterium]|nr:exodeoxyribonuclease VII large subunit [Bacteroidaceae bacterium]
MINSVEEPLTLYSLNNLVRGAINKTLPLRYWVTGELSEVREASNGHCYIELVQRDEVTNELVAKARGTVWARVYSLLRPYFFEQTGQPFAAGLKVLLQVSVGFHELYGYTLDVCDIEPAFTIGDMVRQKQLIIKRLTEEGVIDLNKELDFPLLPQRIAVISSSSAAGYGDFCDQLLGNRYGFVFYPRLFPAPMQGSGVEQGIIAALDEISKNIDCWDVVVIIRGGGATSELSCFDTYDLACNCAQFPLPIITGIGHQRDESVLDVVAHTRAKTPTAAAELLIHAMLSQATMLSDIQAGMAVAAKKRLDDAHTRLQAVLQRLPVATALFMQSQHHKLDLCQRSMEAASPEHILALGYSITRVNGKAVRSLDDVMPGDSVATMVAGGEFISVITEKKK